MRRIVMFVLCCILLFSSAYAMGSIQLHTANNQRWFFHNGGIVQAERIENGEVDSETLLIYSNGADVVWTLPLSKRSLGRMYCELLDEQTLALLYHDAQNQYYIETFDVTGKAAHIQQLPQGVSEAALFDQGYVFIQKEETASVITLTAGDWNGQQKSWQMPGVKQMTAHPVDVIGGKLYLEAHYQDSDGQPRISMLCIDADGTFLWEYPLNDPTTLVKGKYENEHSGINLLVQTSPESDDWKLELIILDANGKEVDRSLLEGINPTMPIYFVEQDKTDAFRIWGSNDGKIISALFDVHGQKLEESSADVYGMGACVRYINNQIYVCITDMENEYFELIPLTNLLP